MVIVFCIKKQANTRLEETWEIKKMLNMFVKKVRERDYRKLGWSKDVKYVREREREREDFCASLLVGKGIG